MKRILLLAATTLPILAVAPVQAQMKIPGDPAPTCVLTEAEFQSWFKGGKASVNGLVQPRDSERFDTGSDVCDFYKWGHQMFLWLTSPVEGGDIVLDDASFYTVLGTGELMSAADNALHLKVAVRSSKVDDITDISQAGGGGVLMSQNGSLVYYGVHVNDVWAYYNTAVNAPKEVSKLQMPDFPVNSDNVDAVFKWADAHIPGANPNPADRVAMTMEIKTSWVDASTVPDKSKFITINADVPSFDRSNPDKWPASDTTRPMELALVGMHVVGTVQDHPEMVWATFENIWNTPDGPYWYQNNKNEVVEVPFDASGQYLFMKTGGAMSGANTQCMSLCDGAIQAGANCQATTPNCSGGIVSSDTYREHPWGASTADKSDAKAVENNTMLLSLNNSSGAGFEKLIPADVRRNYVQIGGIWTTIPDGGTLAPIPDQKDYSAADLRGSLLLANSSMETYEQHINCFTCHSISGSKPGRGVSHLMGFAKPLPTR